MANITRVTVSFLFKGTSLTRNADMMSFVMEEIEKRNGLDATYVIATLNEGTENGRRELGRAGNGGEGTEGKRAEAGSGKAADADGGDGKAAGKPRGRPRKSDDADGGNADAGNGEEARSSGGKRGGGKRAEAGEDRGGNVSSGTDEGADEGNVGRAEGRGGAGGRGGAVGGDRQAARVSSGEDRGEADDDWGDDAAAPKEDEWEEENPRLVAARMPASKWPDDLLPVARDEIDKTVLTTLLSEHFNANGGNKAKTLDLMETTTGHRAVKDVDPADYRKLACTLMHSAARYEFGLEK